MGVPSLTDPNLLKMKIYNALAKNFEPFPIKCLVAKRVGLIFAAIFSLGLALISKNIREAIFHGRTLNMVDGSLIKEAVFHFGVSIDEDLITKIEEKSDKDEYMVALTDIC